jgi:integrase
MRRKQAEMKKTAFPGVFDLGGGLYQVRGRRLSKKTGRQKEIDQQVEARSAAHANQIRETLLDDALEASQAPDRLPRVSTFVDIWIARKKPDLAPSTLDRYVREMAIHLVGREADGQLEAHAPHPLADVYVDKVTHGDVIDWRNSLPGNPTTVNSIFRTFKGMLCDAWVTYALPGTCPAERVKARKEPPVYTDEDPNLIPRDELFELLSGVQRVAALKWYALFSLMAFTGTRPGEATVVRWEDVREEDARHGPHIAIRRSHWRGHIREVTKNDLWRRPPLPLELRDILRALRREQMAEQGVGGAAAQMNALRRAESGWLFPTRSGNAPCATQTARNALIDAQDAIARELADSSPYYLSLTPKGLRRTFNDLLRQQSPGLVVRSIMGHADERMTERYAPVRGAEKTAAVVTALRLGGPPPADATSPTSSPTSAKHGGTSSHAGGQNPRENTQKPR